MENALHLLRKYWGYQQFRPHQRPIVEAVASGRDVLAILPTGGGKSLAFQVPALLRRGTTLVITPLVALMEDQVGQLKKLGLPAACLHGGQPAEERRTVLAGIVREGWQLLYLSPETLLSPPVWSRLQKISVARLVLDEAHCLVSWGSTFRPDYHRIGAARRALGNPPLCAFTATATPQVQQELIRLLGLVDPEQLIVPPYRANLALSVQWIWTPNQRIERIQSFLKCQGNTQGLIYLRTRDGSEALANLLRRRGWSTACYHAGLRAAERRNIEHDWQTGKLAFLCSTNAFGMGIDQPHVRWVLHGNTPPTIEEYIQEIGRAGRDGQPAAALLLASEPSGLIEPTDRRLHQHFRKQQTENEAKAAQLFERRRSGWGEYQPQEALSLALLHRRGQLVWEDPFWYRLVEGSPLPRAKNSAAPMNAYLWTRGCRWRFLLATFGFTEGPACGRCDRCTRLSIP